MGCLSSSICLWACRVGLRSASETEIPLSRILRRRLNLRFAVNAIEAKDGLIGRQPSWQSSLAGAQDRSSGGAAIRVASERTTLLCETLFMFGVASCEMTT